MKFLMEQIALRLFSSVVQYTSISLPSCSVWFRLTVDLHNCLPQHHEGWAAGWHRTIFHLNPGSWSWTIQCFEEHQKMHTHPKSLMHRYMEQSLGSSHWVLVSLWHGVAQGMRGGWASTAPPGKIQLRKGKSRRKCGACMKDTNKSKAKSSSS